MEKQKHTPGPWTVDEERVTDIVIRNSNRDPVALGYLSGWDKKTACANARLIAAAPELLEALRQILVRLKNRNNLGDVISFIEDVARTAIAKAVGEEKGENDGN